MKRKKHFILIISLVLIFVLAFTSFIFATDNYEYNDFDLYTTNGVGVTSGAFRSNNSSMSEFYIRVMLGSGSWSITGGTNSTIPCPSGYELDHTTFSSQARIVVSGHTYYFSQDEQTGHWFAGPITTYGYPNVSVYFPYVAISGNVPSTPVLSISNNQLLWTPPGYATRVLYSSTGTGSYTVLTDNGSSPYTISEEGFYRVQLWYTRNGETLITDTSNRVEYISSSSGSDTSLLDRIINFFNNLTVGIRNAVQTISQFLSNIGEVFNNIFAWLPYEVRNIFWSVVIVGLVLGIFIK